HSASVEEDAKKQHDEHGEDGPPLMESQLPAALVAPYSSAWTREADRGRHSSTDMSHIEPTLAQRTVGRLEERHLTPALSGPRSWRQVCACKLGDSCAGSAAALG